MRDLVIYIDNWDTSSQFNCNIGNEALAGHEKTDKMHPTRRLHRLCSSGRTDAECIGALRSLQEGPLRVRGKRSSVCPGIEKGIPKASRQIDGEREGGKGEGQKAVGREDGKDRAREKQCCCRLPRDTRKIRELRALEPACVHADHEKRTERRVGTNCKPDFPAAEYPPSLPADLNFRPPAPSRCQFRAKGYNGSYESQANTFGTRQRGGVRFKVKARGKRAFSFLSLRLLV